MMLPALDPIRCTPRFKALVQHALSGELHDRNCFRPG
jgi:hypothetical protein